jgi:hypothetical protein
MCGFSRVAYGDYNDAGFSPLGLIVPAFLIWSLIKQANPVKLPPS